VGFEKFNILHDVSRIRYFCGTSMALSSLNALHPIAACPTTLRQNLASITSTQCDVFLPSGTQQWREEGTRNG